MFFFYYWYFVGYYGRFLGVEENGFILEIFVDYNILRFL